VYVTAALVRQQKIVTVLVRLGIATILVHSANVKAERATKTKIAQNVSAHLMFVTTIVKLANVQAETAKLQAADVPVVSVLLGFAKVNVSSALVRAVLATKQENVNVPAT
jgi:hypothetical protein